MFARCFTPIIHQFFTPFGLSGFLFYCFTPFGILPSAPTIILSFQLTKIKHNCLLGLKNPYLVFLLYKQYNNWYCRFVQYADLEKILLTIRCTSVILYIVKNTFPVSLPMTLWSSPLNNSRQPEIPKILADDTFVRIFN